VTAPDMSLFSDDSSVLSGRECCCRWDN